MFWLTPEEAVAMRSQFVIGSKRNLRFQPYAFTEHGVPMLSAVLKSARAVQMSILVVRAFAKLRELLASHKDLAARVEKREATQRDQGSIISILADEIDGMKRLPEAPRRQIGFQPAS